MPGFTPWVAGQTSPTWTILCQRDGKVFDLTGQTASNISILFYCNVATIIQNNMASYTKVGTGTGTATIVSSNPGVIQYAPATADTFSLIPGQYWVRVKILMGGTSADYSDYLPLFVEA